MKTYVMTTGAVFALLVAVHVWRAVEEGAGILKDPFFVAVTVKTGPALHRASTTIRRDSSTSSTRPDPRPRSSSGAVSLRRIPRS